ncbi:M20/M25/M40 family metallo-hydrolase [Leptospira wolffii]|uniref:M20/M25/M40 family metallo-hydrolase n=1 Tax=Leptospira wolffii TaxID=409998 RepID=UPI00108242E3|nr:M20/M25/M40 family metallo-hydrolase [Leptospira wolffii]TGK61856.1 M20/M25/M40 family metallo-hydrolase [Leptospira wolffii]TGK65943.1 M20/M25/M40 family metallo-hydrolase [Leptospira wolffii]TGK74760.1 M20/M25/M40 family metallo-hydrolase [Leptospira wolffii]TGL30826.1 M20/M25/M40 family metallo-hydrolase [Leptospira wolffii]
MSLKKIGIAILAFLAIFILYTIAFTENSIDPITPSSVPPTANYSAISEEAAKDLQTYIRIATVRGREREGALFLKSVLDKRGIPSRIIEYPGKPDRASLVAELKGKDPTKGGLILTNHIDVVEADAKEWTEPPFSGVRKDNRIHGRGAVDVKGLGIMQLHAFILAHEKKVPLQSNLMFLAVADEESRSEHGTRFLIAKHREIFQGYEYVWNEGGTGSKNVAIDGSKLFNIQLAEKGAVWLDLKAKANSGHGSTPPNNYAAKSMVGFLQEVQTLGKKTMIQDQAAAFFYSLSNLLPFPDSFVLRRSRNPLLFLLLQGTINRSRHLVAMTRNTVSITGIDTHPIGINVITSEAEGSLDIRILPGQDEKVILEKVKEIGAKYEVEVTPRHMETGSVSPMDGLLFRVMAGVSTNIVPGAIAAPFLSPGTTDSSYLRQIGLKCYGLIPGLLSTEEIDGIHGKDESLSVEHLKMGIEILFKTIVEYNHQIQR